MKRTDSETRLREAIVQLEKQHAVESAQLKAQFHLVSERLEPINLLKNTFKEAAASQDLKQDIINTSIGLGVGYLSKRFLKEDTKGPSKKLIAAGLLLGIAAVIAKNPEAAKAFGKNVLRLILHKSSESVSDSEYD